MTNLLKRLADQFRGLLAAAGLSMSHEPLTIDQNPVPASRPRVSKWGVYYGKRYTAWRKEAEKQLKEVKDITDEPLIVVVEHYVKKPKTTKRLYPQGDVDNYLKPPLDAITTHSKHWEDDDQVVAAFTFKTYTEEEPKTVVYIYEAKAY